MYKINTVNHMKISKQGMTFVEVLVSTVILSVVIGGSITVFAKCNIFANEIRERSIVNYALNAEMERIRSMDDYTTILNYTTCTPIELIQLNNATCTPTLEDPFADSDIRKVTLTVNWASPQGRSLTKSLVALVTNGGI